MRAWALEWLPALMPALMLMQVALVQPELVLWVAFGGCRYPLR
jgi:hypothetical protein